MKKTRILENIYDIILDTSFKEEAIKQFKQDTKKITFQLDKEKNTITFFDKNQERILYTITIQ